MPADLGLVVPAYRPDPGRLRRYARGLVAELDPARLRIELDAPRPPVRDAAAGLAAELDAVELRAVDSRRGKGAAVTAGFEALAPDVSTLAFADADGSTPPGSVAAVVAPVGAGRADLAVGSRRHPDALVRGHQTLARRRLGDAFAWLARRLLDARLYDYQCGTKAVSTTAWRAVRDDIREPGFAWDVELIAAIAARDRRLVEVAVEWEDQPGSTVSPVRDGVALARALVVARHRARAGRGDRLHRLLARGDRTPPLVDRLAGETAETEEEPA